MGERPPPGDPLARLAAGLGLELPIFEGPLGAFLVGEGSGHGASVYLGGDLHAVYPEYADRRSGMGRDRSLDGAGVTIDDHEHEKLEVEAVDGIWCLALPEVLLRSAPWFAVHDARGRLRIWLLLPPARAMIGIGHLWLPSVPPPPGTIGPEP